MQASATEWFGRSAEQAREAGYLGNLPLIVLTAGRLTRGGPETNEDHRAWLQLHSELARLSTRGYQTVVANSGHLMPFDAPDAIVSATRELVVRYERGERLQ